MPFYSQVQDLEYGHEFNNIESLGLRLSTTTGFVKREREDSCASFVSDASSMDSNMGFSPMTPNPSPISPSTSTICPDMLLSSAYCHDALASLSFTSNTPTQLSSMPFVYSIDEMSSDEHNASDNSFGFSLSNTCNPNISFSSGEFYPFGLDSFYSESLEERPSSPEGSVSGQSSTEGLSFADLDQSDDCSETKVKRTKRSSGVDMKQLPFIVSSVNKIHKCRLMNSEGHPCDRSFKRHEHLRRHIKTHSSLKEFDCPIKDCKSFSRRDNLKAHWKTHSKPYGRNKYLPHLPESPEEYIKLIEACPELAV